MRQEIDAWRQERGIPYLLHFTRLENLASIIQHGLIPRAELGAGGANCTVNDDQRLDQRSEFNCLSLAFPNGPMFYRFQQENPGVNWAILVINPIVLATKNTLFCRHNAADIRMSSAPACELSSLDAFHGMFEDIEGCPSRADQRLKKCDPTDVQAEVLIEGVIEPGYIVAVVFRSTADRDQNENIVGERKTYVHTRKGLFGTRGYYRQFGGGA